MANSHTQKSSSPFFNPSEEAIIQNTSNIELDGTLVRIMGMANDFTENGYCHYIVGKIDNTLWSNGYSFFPISSFCLKKIDH